ncbi:MAG: LytTR family DNA-binding domain-containing protein [Lachnospiraceae bacterium]|nr:LytTR family DNA-binding domain-containing protein [Lachnospiraceae bacterium]
MIYIAICDDEENTAELLNIKVKACLKELNITAEIIKYTQSRQLIWDIQDGKYFDLIISDIEMPCVGGMELVAAARKYLPEVLVIFITSYLKYAVDAYELSVFRYIPKNQIDMRLKSALQDASHRISLQSGQYYKILTPSRLEKISYHRIMFIKKEGKNSCIVLRDNSETKIRKSLAVVFEELNSKDFMYIDRGIIVNISHISCVKDDFVELENGISLPASHGKIEEIKARLLTFWGEQIG